MSIFDKIKKYSGTSFTYNKLNSNKSNNIMRLDRMEAYPERILKKKTAY